MRQIIPLALLLMCALCGYVFANDTYEVSWKLDKRNYKALIEVPEDSSTAYGKVRITGNDGKLNDFVEEKFRIQVDDDKIILRGFGLDEDAEYSPDNFLIFKSGKAFVIDDAGRTRPITIRVLTKDEYKEMARKYHQK